MEPEEPKPQPWVKFVKPKAKQHSAPKPKDREEADRPVPKAAQAAADASIAGMQREVEQLRKQVSSFASSSQGPRRSLSRSSSSSEETSEPAAKKKKKKKAQKKKDKKDLKTLRAFQKMIAK